MLRDRVAEKAEQRRWWILGVLCFSLLVIVLDNSILNVAIPTIVRELDATNSDLQWIVDAYTIVFAGLLLTAGSLGDRYGRRPALQLGLTIFGVGSLSAALAANADQLIGARAFMGIGGAFIMPATLSIITNVFPAPERPKAIGVWAGTAGVAVALGPLTGGFLLEHFYWGSVFLVNLPVVTVGLLAGVFLIPDSKDPHPQRLDPVGALLSIVGLATLLYAIIEGPDLGWTDSTTLSAFAVGGVILATFFWWELRSDHPMLDLRFFKNPRFSVASGAIALTFFAMFGSIFLMTQYLQFVIGYTPLQTGVRMLAYAIPMMIVAPLSARFVVKLGAKVVVAGGMVTFVIGLLSSVGLEATSSYGAIAWRMVLMGAGMALVMAPATDSIMGSVPLARAGVGSAVNDTTRQIGGAVGVAIIGSVFSSIYSANVGDALAGRPVPPGIAQGIKDSVGYALGVAQRLGGATGGGLADAARSAFVDGMHAGLVVAGAVALVGTVAVVIWLPARARREDVERQQAEYRAHAAALARLAVPSETAEPAVGANAAAPAPVPGPPEPSPPVEVAGG
jgi:EmrB/QacA subfamily drug resistance transporter